MMDNKNKLSEEEKDQLRSVVNAHISQYCNYAALVIILITLASFVLGQFDVFFVQLGIMISIALLAIAAINNPTRKKITAKNNGKKFSAGVPGRCNRLSLNMPSKPSFRREFSTGGNLNLQRVEPPASLISSKPSP